VAVLTARVCQSFRNRICIESLSSGHAQACPDSSPEPRSAERPARVAADLGSRSFVRATLPTLKREVATRTRPAIDRTISRSPWGEVQRHFERLPHPDLPELNLQPDAFVDYARTLTPEGALCSPVWPNGSRTKTLCPRARRSGAGQFSPSTVEVLPERAPAIVTCGRSSI
jgi:hypothetical protein